MAANINRKGFVLTNGDATGKQLAIALPTDYRVLHVASAADVETDWNVANPTHPTFYIHSETTPATDYISFTHDGTAGTISVAGGTLAINGVTTLGLQVGGTEEVTLSAAALYPTTNDGSALGIVTTNQWADLFLASGGVINFNGDVTLTHAANELTIAGGTVIIGTSASIQVNDDRSIDFGTGPDAFLLWETADANANALIFGLPGGDATNVPVLLIGVGLSNVDLGLYDGVVDPRIAMFGVGAVTTGVGIDFRKARGTVAAPTVCTTGDDVGTIRGYGAVAAGEYVQTAEIRMDIAGTIATTRGPGTITFLTATDAAPSVLTQAMIISAAQVVTLAAGVTTGNHTFSLTVTGSNGVGTSGEQLQSAGAATQVLWGSAASIREVKDLLGTVNDKAQEALNRVLKAPVYDFHYKEGVRPSTGDFDTTYRGVVADEYPEVMHHGGRIFNPINAFGELVLAIQALTKRIESMEATPA